MHKYTLMDMTAAEKIKLRAKHLNIKIDEVATDANVDRSTMGRWKGDYDYLRFGSVRRVATRLKVTVDWLFDDKQGYPPPPAAEIHQDATDQRLIGLEGDLPPRMTREEILEAVWDFQKARVRRPGQATSTGGARSDQAEYDAKRQVPQTLPGKPAGGEGKELRRAAQ